MRLIGAVIALLTALPAQAQQTDCDRLAGYPLIPRVEGAVGVYAVRAPVEAVAACEAARGAAPGDAFLAILEARARLALDPQDSGALPLLTEAIQTLPALASGVLGQLYEFGLAGLPQADTTAREHYQTACTDWPDRHAAPGCAGLALMMIQGRGGDEDLPGGIALLGDLCSGGWAEACTELAFQTDLNGLGDLATISARIAGLFEAGCDAGDLLACSQYGFRLELGDGVEMDVARAATLYGQSCEGGEPQGCSYLGEIYRSGLGVQPDITEAVRLFALGCDGNDPYACVTLGDILAEGRGVPPDVPRALAVLERACTLGDPDACFLADDLR
ncbi:tetratricopeptide repeat protein [Pararhodobacter zhoushanensis]|uniref:Sel1 repeat family protein n=1 Tax=Pararhodobacter zhoushanensis TaxID=2479545 RepID=A0ABT3H414_9RHOB|nr:tetratricopeptide repeat protein [Pararhodobacter zhoushanensis]MCW1934425.1 sel1 repeat family protein [Pararhodobacter zhoushanensis]